MHLRLPTHHALLLAMSVISITLTGCSDIQLHDMIEKFNTSVKSSQSAIKELYLQSNDVRRNLYLTELKLQPGKDAVITWPAGTGSGGLDAAMIEYYSDDYIQTRLDAFDALASYTASLSLLATSTAPQDAEDAINATGKKIAALSNQIQSHSTNPVDITNYSTPIAQIVGLITHEVMDYIRDKKLKSNLKKSKDTVRIVAQALITDLDAMNDVTSTATTGVLTRYKVLYNSTPTLKNGDVTDQTRAKFLTEMGSVAKQVADLDSTSPSDLVRQIQSAHDKLIDYLCDKKDTKQDNKKSVESEIVVNLDKFEADAEVIRDSIRKLKQP